MLPDEAILMGQWIRSLDLRKGAVCLNFGSSTRHFREVVQPHIDEHVFAPLRQAGVRTIHCDLKVDDGVDEVGDVLDPGVRSRLAGYEPELVICSNLLEHLTDPATFAQACGEILRPGGHCLITVPRSFPYHPDPIDTMYRPEPSEVAALLPEWQVVSAKEIAAGSYADDLRTHAAPTVALLRQAIRAAMPFYRPSQWRPAAHKLMWLFKPYRVSLVMLRKPEHHAADSRVR
ncbi:methyltransferase type 11 [Erythrobacteraceae bacterium CFH 75059]|uniref:methyltransferase domain-containing protein n=1 Tax=Qipengyuania thermophila TaxID=2509361 RepID=UPI0010220F4D|nr:methyltransferase domain-containing protein [Qipengyuania thermophila]TCD06873.1 methyltransferase type 11 [Erythrobacteraceae bacterium CFH 75059]